MQPNWFFALPVTMPFLPQILRGMPESCRGFAVEDLHMTLAFLGPLAPTKVAAMVELLETIEGAPFQISLGELLALPTAKRPSAFAFGLNQGRDEAVALMERNRDALLAAAGARPDARPALPHITVARPMRSYGAQGIRQALSWSQTLIPPSDTLIVDRVALYTWAEDRRVQQFQRVAEQPLKATLGP